MIELWLARSKGEAVKYLLSRRNADGMWTDFDTLAGTSDEWVTAYIGTMLARTGETTAVQAAKDAWNKLCSRRRFSAGWGFNGRVPADADSTLWAVHLARQLDWTRQPKVGRAYRFLLKHQRSDGSIATYAESGPIRLFTRLKKDISFQGWCQGHPSVTAIAACLSDFAGYSQCLEYLRRTQRSDGSWDSYWWCNPEYSVAVAVRALSKNGSASDKRSVNNAADWATRRLAYGENLTAFTTSLCLSILAFSKGIERLPAQMEQAANNLIDLQQPDGSWQPSARLRIPPPFITDPESYSKWVFNGRGGGSTQVDQNACFTTATALGALLDSENSLNRITHGLPTLT